MKNETMIWKENKDDHMTELGRRRKGKIKTLSNYVIFLQKEKEEKSLSTMLYITYILILLLKTY